MFEDLKEEIIKFGKIAGDRNLSPGISGNISIRSGGNIIITSSGSANSFLDYDDICVIDFDGNLIEGCSKPSSEKFLHSEFYKRRNDIGAICRFYCPYLTAFALSQYPLKDKILPEIVYMFGEIPAAEYALPGSIDLVENTAKYFANYNVIMMKNHGVISAGRDLREAYLNVELCEVYAKTFVLSKFLGGARILSENQVDDIYSLKQNN